MKIIDLMADATVLMGVPTFYTCLLKSPRLDSQTTAGMPLPDVEIRITDRESGAPLPPGEIGSIEVRGPNVFQCYWRMPEKTDSEFRDDHFFITADLGLIDTDGYLRIVGRDKDLVISGGYNVYPKREVILVDELPRNVMGKVQKNERRTRYADIYKV